MPNNVRREEPPVVEEPQIRLPERDNLEDVFDEIPLRPAGDTEDIAEEFIQEHRDAIEREMRDAEDRFAGDMIMGIDATMREVDGPQPIRVQYMDPRPGTHTAMINDLEAEADRIRRRNAEMLSEFNPYTTRVRRGARLAMDEGSEIPANVIPEPNRPRPFPPMPKKAPVRTKRKHVFPEEGVMHLGYKFARKLSDVEDFYLRASGYAGCIQKFPDLEFKVKEMPIDDNEECIVLLSELADHYATQECTECIQGFDLKDHNKEYQAAYKKHLKAITGFKRNKHG